MRLAATLFAVALLGACAPAEEAPPAMEEAPETPALTLADFAGTWQNMATLEGVADPIPSTLHGSADASGWSMDLEGRDGIPMTVSIMGDSLVAETVEYESILRAGVMVSVRTASVLQDGVLVGSLVATYQTPDGVETVAGTMRATRN
jgi:hypothetical protein